MEKVKFLIRLVDKKLAELLKKKWFDFFVAQIAQIDECTKVTLLFSEPDVLELLIDSEDFKASYFMKRIYPVLETKDGKLVLINSGNIKPQVMNEIKATFDNALLLITPKFAFEFDDKLHDIRIGLSVIDEKSLIEMIYPVLQKEGSEGIDSAVADQLEKVVAEQDFKHNWLIQVSELPLSIRTINCLKAADIEYLGDVGVTSEKEISKYRNFGSRSMRELKLMMELFGITFQSAPKDWQPENAEELSAKYYSRQKSIMESYIENMAGEADWYKYFYLPIKWLPIEGGIKKDLLDGGVNFLYRLFVHEEDRRLKNAHEELKKIGGFLKIDLGSSIVKNLSSFLYNNGNVTEMSRKYYPNQESVSSLFKSLK